MPVPSSLNSKTTQKRREEVIKQGAYIDENKYNERYKQEDIKTSLSVIYKNKCAFCEQRVEQAHIEHYRPKSTYFWLAYSWDNLLLACPDCNQAKSNHFLIENEIVALYPSDLADIHVLASKYNQLEQPKLIHPELEEVSSFIVFDEHGHISSDNERVNYTINTCKIDRTELNDMRKKILDDLIRDIEAEIFFAEGENLKSRISVLLRKFQRDSQVIENEFLTFRRYVIAHLLAGVLHKILN